MVEKYYKFFDTVIKTITPYSPDDSEPYSVFGCENLTPFCSVSVEFVKSFPPIPDNAVQGNDLIYVTENETSYCWFKNHGADGFFACRYCNGNERGIMLSDLYKEKLWNRVIFELMGFEEIMAENSAVVLHASVIIKNGNAILFTAPSGTGKSTQASLWEKYSQAEIVNGDKALIKNINGKCYAGGLPFSGSSGICKNFFAPVRAIICLYQSGENKITALSENEAFLSLFKGCYRSVENEGATKKRLQAIEEISRIVPIYSYGCVPDETAVRLLEKELCL